MPKQSFLKGTIILTTAGLITRLLGFINRIMMARLMGEEGIGLYNMALPTLFLMYTLSQVGLPIAISKRVAEANAYQDRKKIKTILVVSLTITGSLSILFICLMIFLSPYIANHLLTDNRTLYPLLAITPMVPISAISAVLRGYFQGLQNMKPQSYAQIIEQVIRIGCITFFVNLLIPYGVEYAAAGAMFSVIVGEFVSLVFMFSYFKTSKKIKVRRQFFSTLKASKTTIQSLLSIAIPSTGSRLISSLSNFLEPILVAQSLAIAGFSTVMATKQYGILTGYAIPLLFFPTFITHALAIALIPNISEAEAKQQHRTVHYRINQAIRISFASGAIASVVLFLFAEPILMYMYNDTQASYLIQFMSPFFLFVYLQFPLNATLQALDFAKVAMWNTLLATILKYAILVVLTIQPTLGIFGTVIALSASAIFTTLLHYTSLKKLINFQLAFRDLFKMLLLVLLTYITGKVLMAWFPFYQDNLWLLVILITVMIGLYLIYIFALKIITLKEVRPLIRKR
ncbi:stage V sporulation protein B [Amphibacillus jilinensis]|uniref:stage V sporulation protein B n=1 Tax=Amphibacillus jilinensis TaxID=1216008 RepID=UPI0002E9595F|nr:stage V sporulation protein B [Amphibacillus jilinensis]